MAELLALSGREVSPAKPLSAEAVPGKFIGSVHSQGSCREWLCRVLSLQPSQCPWQPWRVFLMGPALAVCWFTWILPVEWQTLQVETGIQLK